MRKSNIKEVVPTPDKVWKTYYEAINPDSLPDAFEVIEDWAERFCESLRSR